MKKLVLAAAVLLGGMAASQAGVSVNIGFGLPFPRPVIISRPAPVVVAPACPTPVVVAPPACPTPVVVSRPSYHHHGHYTPVVTPRYGHSGHRDWDRHDDHGRYGRDNRHDDHRDNRDRYSSHDRGGWLSHRR